MSIDRLHDKIRKVKNPTVVNFDVLPEYIPPQLVEQAGDRLNAYCLMCYQLMEALQGIVPAVRFSFSSLALYADRGLSVLSKLLSQAKALGYYVMLDIPDAHSAQSAAHHANLILSEGSLWDCDAYILSAYIGSDAVKPYIQKLKERDKTLFISVRTANRSASELQDLLTGTRLVHLAHMDKLFLLGSQLKGKCGFSRVGAVAPANSASVLRNIRQKNPSAFLLLDGFDYPGANAKICGEALNQFGHGAIACAGNSIVGAWYLEDSRPEEYISASVAAAERMKKNLNKYKAVL